MQLVRKGKYSLEQYEIDKAFVEKVRQISSANNPDVSAEIDIPAGYFDRNPDQRARWENAGWTVLEDAPKMERGPSKGQSAKAE